MCSSFSGEIEEIPFIHVDNFENLTKPAYFLSHYHGDHVVGLKNRVLTSRLFENSGTIYASEVTVAIIKNEVPDMEPFLKVLDLGTNTIMVYDGDIERYLTVVMLPAGHSLGSVMFLFKYEHTVLYTGDFRITPNTLAKFTHLHKNGEPINIDVIYIDTTFQDVESFPRRSDVVRNVTAHVKGWLDRSDHHKVELITPANYGYEFVCNELYTATGVKTFVDQRKWYIFRQFPKEMYGITNDRNTRISLKTKYATETPDSRELLKIYFSAMVWVRSGQTPDENYINIVRENYIGVCFSTHCGRDELLHFINYFKPQKIRGFPREFDSKRSPVKMANAGRSNLVMRPLNFENCTPKRKCEDENTRVGKKFCNENFNSYGNKNTGVGKKMTEEKRNSMFEW